MIWKLLSALLALAAALLAVPAVRHAREVPPPPPPAIHAQLATPAELMLGGGREGLDAAIAPDEQSLVVVGVSDGTARLWRLALGGTGRADAIAGTEGASLPTWRPDGRALAFFANGQLKLLTLDTGAVTDLMPAPAPGGAVWLPDGAMAVVPDTAGPVKRWQAGHVTPLTTLGPDDAGHAFPRTDDTGRLLYVALSRAGTRTVHLVGATGDHALTETSGHAELQRGLLLHVRDQVLLAQRVADDGTRLIGKSAALATGIGTSERGRALLAVSPRLIVWGPATPHLSQLTWFDGSGARTSAAAEPGDYWQVRLSPDERAAAVTALDPLLRTLDVFLMPLAAPGNARRLSLALGPDSDPVWAPTGASVLYRSAQKGPGAIFSRSATRPAETEEEVLRRPLALTPSDWRGSTWLFHTPDERGRLTVFARDRATNRETALTQGGFNSWDARWSPDLRWIAYTSDESGQPEVYVQGYPRPQPRVRATFGGGQRPQWSADGSLYFRRGDAVMRTRLDAAVPPVIATPQTVIKAAGLRDFAVTTDGRRILAIADADDSMPATARLIVDWPGLVPPPAPPTR